VLLWRFAQEMRNQAHKRAVNAVAASESQAALRLRPSLRELAQRSWRCVLSRQWKFHHDASSLASASINDCRASQRFCSITDALQTMAAIPDFLDIKAGPPVLNLDADAVLFLGKSHEYAIAMTMTAGICKAFLNNAKNCHMPRTWKLIELAIMAEFDFGTATAPTFHNQMFDGFQYASAIQMERWKTANQPAEFDGRPHQERESRIEVTGIVQNAVAIPIAEGFQQGHCRRDILAGAIVQFVTNEIKFLLQIIG
jgi:hypothetical protein